MTETYLNSEASKLLEDLRLLLEKGNQFVLEEAPPLAKEIVTYGRVVHILWIIIALMIAFSVYKLAPKVKEAWKDLDNVFMGVGGLIYCGGGTIVSVVMILCNVESAVKVWFAPRLYLLDYVLSALK